MASVWGIEYSEFRGIYALRRAGHIYACMQLHKSVFTAFNAYSSVNMKYSQGFILVTKHASIQLFSFYLNPKPYIMLRECYESKFIPRFTMYKIRQILQGSREIDWNMPKAMSSRIQRAWNAIPRPRFREIRWKWIVSGRRSCGVPP